MQTINVIGGGLAGCEAAYRIARQGIKVKLWEMRPAKNTPVHLTADLAELVCSNSLKSDIANTAQGLLKREMRALGSLLLTCAEMAKVPAGSALAVDRRLFARIVTEEIEKQPLIEIIRQEATDIKPDGISIIATGPLTSDNMAQSLIELTGQDSLYFYDAIAPSVTLESLDKTVIYKASRYGKGTDDYYNCPLTKDEYETFQSEIMNADIKAGHEIDKKELFDGCLPIEVIARRGIDTLRFGPMRPVGLNNPETGQRPYAVLQLRQEDRAGEIYGLVGFQTRLKWGEQDRILRLIPGLKAAEFVRYGVMHRNTYINSPKLIAHTLQFRKNPQLFLAGQITGVEGYMESAATGIIAGINAARLIKGRELLKMPPETLMGALINFITTSPGIDFQPINANFGILPQIEPHIRNKQQRYTAYTTRSLKSISELLL